MTYVRDLSCPRLQHASASGKSSCLAQLRLPINFSGTLLKQFEDPAIRETFHDIVDIEYFLDRYKQSNIEFLGTGLYHPVYPLIPADDWEAQTSWWIGLGRHLLG